MESDLAQERPEIIDIQGIRVPVDPALMSEVVIGSLRRGRYEMGEAERLPQIIGPGERVVEVGAGLGFLTALMAKHTPAELVVAVEGNPALIGFIEALHRLNGARTVIVHAIAAPARGPDRGALHVHEDLWASSTAAVKADKLIQTIEVPRLSLAELAAAHAPTLLIIDVEALRAWASAPPGPDALESADFRPFAKVLIELKPKRFPPADVRRVFDLFSAQGFAYSVTASRGPVVLFERVPSAS